MCSRVDADASGLARVLQVAGVKVSGIKSIPELELVRVAHNVTIVSEMMSAFQVCVCVCVMDWQACHRRELQRNIGWRRVTGAAGASSRCTRARIHVCVCLCVCVCRVYGRTPSSVRSSHQMCALGLTAHDTGHQQVNTHTHT